MRAARTYIVAVTKEEQRRGIVRGAIDRAPSVPAFVAPAAQGIDPDAIAIPEALANAARKAPETPDFNPDAPAVDPDAPAIDPRAMKSSAPAVPKPEH